MSRHTTGSEDQSSVGPTTRFTRPMTTSVRAAFFYLGVLAPAFFVVASFCDWVPRPTWQSGELHDIVGFLLHPSGAISIYPFVIYAATSLAFYLYDEKTHGDAFWVRFGIASGAVVSVWYCIVCSLTICKVNMNEPQTWLFAALTFATECVLAIVACGVARLGHLFWNQSNKVRRNRWLIAAVAVSLLCCGAIAWNSGSRFVFDLMLLFVVVPLFVTLLGTPGFALFAYCVVTLRIVYTRTSARRLSLLEAMTVMTWVAGFLAACRLSIKMSLSAYAALPTERPSNCYIATAAARGHRRFVRVDRILANGMPINRQLITFKAFELALIALVPRTHRLLRRGYDRAGPSLARQMTGPFIADFAYIGLKPAEWLARLMLWMMLGPDRDAIDNLYRDDPIAGETSRLV